MIYSATINRGMKIKNWNKRHYLFMHCLGNSQGTVMYNRKNACDVTKSGSNTASMPWKYVNKQKALKWEIAFVRLTIQIDSDLERYWSYVSTGCLKQKKRKAVWGTYV